MVVTFKEFYDDEHLQKIVEKLNVGAKVSKLSPSDISIINARLGVSGKSQIRGFLILMPNKSSTKNSAQQAFVDLANEICADEEAFARLKTLSWFCSQDEVKDISNLQKRYGLVQNAYYVFKDAEVTLLMAKAIRMVIDAKGKDVLENYSFSFDTKAGSTQTDSKNEWWPSLSEYNPHFSKEEWIALLTNPNIVGPVWGKALALFYTKPQGATCSALGEEYNIDSTSLSSNCIQLAKRIHKETNCPLIEEDGKKCYWPLLFVGKNADKEEKGTSIWKLRPELYEALTEFDILRYLKQEEGEKEVIINKKEALKAIKAYIADAGFNYAGNLVENFYLSLKSKPFVILAGTSGTGKTRLAKLFAEAIDARYQLVPVRPDWSDSSDLFGHVDLNGNFVPGTIIDFVKDAKDHPSKPYILCLDEMNLARVEYYLSDFLSVIETRDIKNGHIVSVPLIDIDKYGSDTVAAKKYGRIEYPENLYVVGTVNMDETTFPFSKKVLDRANTIEFNFVNLIPNSTEFEGEPKREAEIIPLPNLFIKTEHLRLKDCAEEAEYIGGLCDELQKINEILQQANAHVGYRVRNEIVFYMLNNHCEDGTILDENEAFDNCLMQKILPRIQGSSASVRDMLCNLFKLCGSDHNQKTGDRDSDKMKKVLDDVSIKCRYRKSAEKLQMMVRRFEEDGFTSYWL